jgi:hypothetical protein
LSHLGVRDDPNLEVMTQLTACGRQVASIRNLNEHAHRREFIRGRIIAKNGKMSR